MIAIRVVKNFRVCADCHNTFKFISTSVPFTLTHAFLQKKVLDEVYADFASIWMKMKVEEETTKTTKNEGHLFKPRAFNIEDVYVFDLSTLEGSFSNNSFAEWNESL